MIERKILVIEDDGTSRTVIKDQLEKAKFVVETASTAHEGIQKSQSNDFDLIMLDLNLPDAYGLEISNHLMQPFIAMTSTTNNDIIEISKQMGAQAFIQKPFKVFDVLNLIQGAIEKGAIAYKDKQNTIIKKKISTPNQNSHHKTPTCDNVFIAMGCLIVDLKISQREAYLRLEKSAKENDLAIDIISGKIVKQYELDNLLSQQR